VPRNVTVGGKKGMRILIRLRVGIGGGKENRHHDVEYGNPQTGKICTGAILS